MLLKGKTAVVTGCNKGIGKKILEVFSANGSTVFACVRNIDEEFKSLLNELKKKFNNQINWTFEAKHFRPCGDWFAFKDLVLVALELSDDDYTNLKEDVEEYFIY